MATLYITEYARQGRDAAGYVQQGIPEAPPTAEQTVAIGASSAASNELNASTTMVVLTADAVCSVAFGAAPTAAATNRRIPANVPVSIAVPANSGFKIAVITNS
jgi:hypothetical protein